MLAFSLAGCTTQLLTSNTLDQASTVDDLAIRQIIFNLAKTKENQWAVPSQVWVSQGQVTTRSSITPSVNDPLTSSVTNTSQIVSQVVAATGALTTTATKTNASTRPNGTGTLSGVLEGQQNWQVVPLQDPQQLRRLQLLYQYGAGQATQNDLLCQYPIPEIPEKGASTLLSAPDVPTKLKATKNTAAKKLKRYIRGNYRRACDNYLTRAKVDWTLAGGNPDPAFITPSAGCVLCTYHFRSFQGLLRRGDKIYINRFSEETVPFEPEKYDYYPVQVNSDLDPIGAGPSDVTGVTKDGYIDWLFIVKDGDRIPDKAMRIGSSNGFTVYTTSPQGFSAFVLAITEATLQSPEIQKISTPPPKNPMIVPPL
jgi:hypothetical protein